MDGIILCFTTSNNKHQREMKYELKITDEHGPFFIAIVGRITLIELK